jgi:serine/threonine-protein kinase HipA
MNKQGVWSVSPAYDLTFSSGPLGEHSTMIMGEGKNPNYEHLLKLANVGNIKKEKALEIINQLKNSIAKWRIFAEEACVSKLQTKNIEGALDHIAKNMVFL